MTTPDPSWQEIDALFQEALERDPSERGPFLDAACADRPALRAAVDRLFQAAEGSAGFLETPVASMAGVRWEDAVPAGDLDDEDMTADRSGERVGPWRLLEQIGRGGMATVYRAERADEDWEQKVAVKVIRRGLDTADVIRRFVTERKILSSLNHPNIARLLDGGVTADGLPFFAMEMVEGLPITQHCDDAGAPLEARLRLFCQVARAVHFAHQNLVVHRDIKPTNILVDRLGTPKLLDFGIARILDPGDGSDLTRTGLRLLTPEYASPEQLAGGVVSTASDIYQLGLLLCVLLTGRRPSLREVPARGAAEPGATRGRIPDLVTSEAAAHRGLDPARLRRRLAGDLATIVQKALRPDSEERYASAEALVRDVERHLDGLPISARPPTLAYRTRKLLRRHPWLTPVSALGIVAAVGYVYTVARHNHELQVERNVARAEAERAREVQSFLVELFHSADPYAPGDPSRGASITVQEALAIGASRVRSELRDRPDLQAALLGAVSDVYSNLDLPGPALQLGEEALDVARAAPGPSDRNLISATARLGRLLRIEGRDDSARVVLARGLARSREALGRQDTLTSSFLLEMARMETDAGRFGEAEPLLAQAIEELEEGRPASDAQLARAWKLMGVVHARLGRLTAAREAAERELSLVQMVYGEEHPQTALATVDLADALDQEGRDREAIELYRAALGPLQAAFGDTHRETLNTRNNLAVTLQEVGDLAAAADVLRENLAIRVARSGEENLEVAQTYQNLAVVVERQGRLAEAENLLVRAHRSFVAVLAPGHYLTAFPLLTRSGIRLKLGDGAAALVTAGKAERILADALPAGHFATAVATCRRGRALAILGRTAEALESLSEAAAVLMASEGTPPEYERECLEAAANMLEAAGRVTDAAPLRERLRAGDAAG